MIVDTLENWRTYPLGPTWEKAFLFLESLTPEMAVGKYAIDGTDIFAVVAEYETVPENSKPYESHREYMDVQFLLRGHEWFDYAPVKALAVTQDYDPAKGDVMRYARDGAPTTRITLGDGVFAALYPEDGHAPGVAMDGKPAPVKKVVVKVRVSLLAGR
ncbi:YhcH/YjgK/YiaL family protein [Desulfovibrio mangrovi]|uniref:YhcH/YjgK/YiaL family protein n=1 Tax=Desulfovibrio mangrovi TaxID=2976983 RepID=UPI002247D0E4|nr:YhcH/YjgK/YiaL family protein [Desulfovibrio mangrovi]UZP67502.1 YhcH/YjgK/YiaL family protein [Desulfovibrio mangrovi]